MTQDCRVDVRFFAPPAEFSDCFTSIYRLDLTIEPEGADDCRLVDWLQPEWGNLRVFSGNLPAAQVTGGAPVANARFTVTGPSALATRFELGATKFQCGQVRKSHHYCRRKRLLKRLRNTRQ